MKNGDIINQASPVLYRQIAKKLLERFPSRKVTRDQARRTLGLCFKIHRKYKNKVFKELEDYGLLVPVNKHEFYIHYQELDGDELKEKMIKNDD